MDVYITFGAQYSHEEHPKWPQAHPDGWLTIEAENEIQAREIAVALLGLQWSTSYTAETLEPRFFPRGEIGRYGWKKGMEEETDE